MARQGLQAHPSTLAQYMGSSAELMRALTGSPEPVGWENPVWLGLKALARDGGGTSLMRRYADALEPYVWNHGRPNKSLIARAYILCQTAVLNRHRGAVGTGDLGTIRQRWYFSKDAEAMGFKFAAQALETYLVRSADVVLVGSHNDAGRAREMDAQRTRFKTDWDAAAEEELAAELGRQTPLNTHYWPKSGWGRAYAGLQSKVMADLVRDGLTYDEMWVRDASRGVEQYNGLVSDFHGALLLEKEGIFEHFQGFCSAAGIPALVAMSGANAFSNVEAVLNDNFRHWEGDYKPSPDNPLHLFIISDHDYSGHVPIQGGAVAQFERYLPDAVEVHRVGISPEQVVEAGRPISEAGYEFNADRHSATREWADEHGIWRGDICYALEVEALEPRQYIPTLVDELIEALGGDEELRRKLLRMAEPDWDVVGREAADRAQRWSEILRTLSALAGWATREYRERRPPVGEAVSDLITPSWRSSDRVRGAIADAVEEQAQQIDLDEFEEHVEGQRWGAWRPVSGEDAEDAVVDLVLSSFEGELRRAAQGIDIDAGGLRDALGRVASMLEPHGLEA